MQVPLVLSITGEPTEREVIKSESNAFWVGDTELPQLDVSSWRVGLVSTRK